MKYEYVINVRDNDKLRESFNALTQKIICFDFEDWYQSGHWGDLYIPHVLVDDGSVIANISVNIMNFMTAGHNRRYIQLGTVMTDPEYRGQGLSRYIMERILEEYKDRVDGIYLFANDSVLDFYPKFGFKAADEYEYGCNVKECDSPYLIERLDTANVTECNRFYEDIKRYEANGDNPNDDFFMHDNIGLYQFWTAAEYGDSIYYLPKEDTYVIADIEEAVLYVRQLAGNNAIDLQRLAKSFDGEIGRVELSYTPKDRTGLEVKRHKEEDCTLFCIGASLNEIEEKKLIFPIISHA